MWLTTFSTSPLSFTVRCTSNTRPTRSERTTEQLWYTASRVATSLRWVPTPSPCTSVIVLQAQMGDQVFPAQMAERVLELHELDEEVVLGVEAGCGHQGFEVAGGPLLDPARPRPGREVHVEGGAEGVGGGQCGVA